MLVQLISVFIIILPGFYYFFSQKGSPEENVQIFEDYSILRLFNQNNNNKNQMAINKEQDDLEQIDILFSKLKIESLEHFNKAMCIEAKELEEIDTILNYNLKTIPKYLRNNIVRELSYIVSQSQSSQTKMGNGQQKDNNHQKHFIHNVTKTKDGKTYLFAMWWNLNYNSITEKNQLCFVLFGFQFNIAPKLVGNLKRKRTEVIAYQPCHCGFLTCNECPILSEEYFEEPIYHHINLSFEQYELLNDWLIKKVKQTTLELTTTNTMKDDVKLLINGGIEENKKLLREN